ncbi:unnamed protein product [Nyctereutes procyonoides]|uniref:(raccoon dog) hypothetical protein n=1 Tax=Nyctereutes procyonoides TaxID=34880 RepID=A0A811YHR5_NYCPR|nr:unnamed protein product [Nyctereutes procyonoides]
MEIIITCHSYLGSLADASQGDDLLLVDTEDHIHIRIYQGNSRKTLTTVKGITDDYNKRKLVKVFKKKFACNGTVIEHPEYRETGVAKDDQTQFMGFKCFWLTEA